jgi:hypothetical protein
MLEKRERGHKWSPGQWLLPPIGCGRFRGLKMAVKKGMHRNKKRILSVQAWIWLRCTIARLRGGWWWCTTPLDPYDDLLVTSVRRLTHVWLHAGPCMACAASVTEKTPTHLPPFPSPKTESGTALFVCVASCASGRYTRS